MKSMQRGIALIQILLITSILSVLAIYMTQTAQMQIQQARWADDKAQAQVFLHSAESRLLFELFTSDKAPRQMPADNNNSDDYRQPDISSKWNFYGVPFTIGDTIKAVIQDQSGLLNLHYPNTPRLKKLISTIEPSQSNVEAIVDSIMDWQDVDSGLRTNGAEAQQYGGSSFIRNGAVPSIYDIVHIKNVSSAIRQLLIRNTTRSQSGAFSVFNATPELLRTFIDDDTVNQIISLRELNQITVRQFQDITGIQEDDRTYYYTSSYLMIDLTSEVGQVKTRKKVIIHLQPYAENLISPINIL